MGIQGLGISLKDLHQNFVLLTIYIKKVIQSLDECDLRRWCNILNFGKSNFWK